MGLLVTKDIVIDLDQIAYTHRVVDKNDKFLKGLVSVGGLGVSIGNEEEFNAIEKMFMWTHQSHLYDEHKKCIRGRNK